MNLIDIIKNIGRKSHGVWEKYYTKEERKIVVPDKTMYEMIKDSCETYSDLYAIDYFGVKMTYRSFLSNIDKASVAFRNLGIRRGDVVSICMPNTPEALISVYALNKIGAICEMIHPLSSEHEIKTYVNDLAFNVYATDWDIKQVIVRKWTDTLAVVKYATSAPTSSTEVACAKIGSTDYYRCDINPNLSVWELEEWDNDITLIYQVKDSDVSYTADLVAAKFVTDVDNSVTTVNTFDALKAATSYNNRMDILPLVSK